MSRRSFGAVMITGHDFRRIERYATGDSRPRQAGAETLRPLLEQQVVEPFRQVTGLPVVAVSTIAASTGPDALEENPVHPACAETAETDYCRESWLVHLAELERRPQAHWHRCDHCRLCAVVPVTGGGRCLAAIKFASADAEAVDDFLKHVRLVQLLVENVSCRDARGLADAARSAPRKSERLWSSLHGSGDAGGATKERPVKVVRAVQFVEDQLGDPKLSVNLIARQLKLNPSYLSNLFVRATGSRISSLIAEKRVERAKTLLTTADLQIKEVSAACGFANPNWFCSVFKSIVGKTPTMFQREALGGHDGPGMVDEAVFTSIASASEPARDDPLAKTWIRSSHL